MKDGYNNCVLLATYWLDFGQGGPARFKNRLAKSGLAQADSVDRLEVWYSADKKSLILEVLDLDGPHRGSTSQRLDETVSDIQSEILAICVPKRMDPLYRCSLFTTRDAADSSANKLEVGFKEIEELIISTCPAVAKATPSNLG